MGSHSVGICKCARQVTKRGPIFSQQLSCQEKTSIPVPKGHFAVYVGEEEKKRFVVPVSYLRNPLFQELLKEAEEKFGYDHGMGRLTVPCTENYFTNLISQLNDL
uniref:Uncharacterized protein n=1 Tax=Chenopodium quinoa TaxID=63459 RepID=A0A803LPI3_CHEQI